LLVSFGIGADLSWKEPSTSTGENPEKARLEYLANSQTRQIERLRDENESLRDWSLGSNDGANIALSNLVQIVSNTASTTRQQIKAAATILAYQAPDAGVTGFAKRFLESLCANADIATDYRIEASELLRRHEAPRITPENVRPNYSSDDAPVEEHEPLADVVARQRARADVLGAELERQAAQYMASSKRNGSDEPSDV
jgi:hypothetical protein